MGIYDRDWYRESYKKKEEKYGKDFSLNHSDKGNDRPKSDRDRQYKTDKKESYEYSWHRERGENANKERTDGFQAAKGNNIPAPFGDDPNDSANVIGLGVCPRCYNMFRVRTPKRALYEYSYVCPSCQQRINIKSERETSRKFKPGPIFLKALGIFLGIIILYIALAFYSTSVYPSLSKWIANTYPSVYEWARGIFPFL